MKQVRTVSDAQGMTQFALLSRLMEWFLAQDEATQAVAAGLFPEGIKPEVAKLILKRLAKGK